MYKLNQICIDLVAKSQPITLNSKLSLKSTSREGKYLILFILNTIVIQFLHFKFYVCSS